MVALSGAVLLSLVSAAALAAFGALLVSLDRRGGPGRTLGVFTLLWSAQVATIHLSFLAEGTGWDRVLALLSQGFVVPLYLFLAHFVVTYPRRLPVADRVWWPFALSAPAVVSVAVILMDVQAGIREGGGNLWGWATLLMLVLPLLAAQVAALGRFALGRLRAAPATERAQMRLASLAMLLYLGYFAPAFSITLADRQAAYRASLGDAGFLVFAACFLAAAAAPLLLGLLLAWRAPRGGERRAYLAATALPFLAGLTFNTVTFGDLTNLFRLAMVALLVYAIARHRLFDLDLRLRRYAGPVATLAVAGAAGGVVLLALGALQGGASAPVQASLPAMLVVGGASAAAGLAAHRPLSRALDAHFPHIRADEEYVARRKHEVYLAAVAMGSDAAHLDHLAHDLGLDPGERRILDGAPAPRRGTAGAFPERYRLERVLAVGSFGPVLQAWDLRVGERVVVKQYAGFGRRAATRGFAREARIMGALAHPHVLAVRDVFRAGDDAFLVLEHAPGGSLEERLAREEALPLPEALDIVRQLLTGLAEAHRQGIVHRDLKPANVLFKHDRAKLADFGVAQDPVLDRAARAAQDWQPGTVAWMAPEQARGDPLGPAADVHAVGAMLYRMLAGRPYLDLQGLDERAARRAIQEQLPALPLAGLPDEVNGLLVESLAKDPAERPADAAVLLRRVDRARRQAGPPAASRRPPGGPAMGDASPTLAAPAPPGGAQRRGSA